MKLIFKIFLFLLIFSSAFWLIRTLDHGKIISMDLQDLGGIPWLYSAICIIFSMLAAFTIQQEWENWNELTSAIRGEARTIRELWLWSCHVSPETRGTIVHGLENYLSVILTEWPSIGQTEKSGGGDRILEMLRKTIKGLGEETEKSQLLQLFNELIRNRNKKFDHSLSHIPHILKNTLIFTDILLIVLSLFIGVKNPWIDYTFTVSIGVLAYTIYIVIDDLDNPFRPGSWHLTFHDYAILLNQIQEEKQDHTPKS
jgi:hypothetical protein